MVYFVFVFIILLALGEYVFILSTMVFIVLLRASKLVLIVMLFASYPIVSVSALFEPAYDYVALVPKFNGQFGYKLDSYGDLVLMAEYGENVYLFTQVSEVLVELPIPDSDKLFEVSMDIRDDFIGVGYVSTHYPGYEAAGIMYLFDSDGGFLRTVYPPVPINWGHFGASVFLGEDFFLAGETWADHIELDEGKVHRFTYQGEYLDSLVAPESSYAATFGARIDGNSEKVVISELNGVHGMLNFGEVHIYSRDLELERTLVSGKTGLNDFGAAIAVTDDYLLIGESIAQVGAHLRAGVAYLYDLEGNLLTTLESPDPVAGGLFGFSVALNDEYIALGEPRAEGTKALEGAVHVFRHDGVFVETVYSPYPESNSEFGKSVVFSGGYLFVGQPGSTVDGLVNAGRVSMFSVRGDNGILDISSGLLIILVFTVILVIVIRIRASHYI